MKLCVDIGATNIKSGIIEDGRLLRTAVTPTDTSHGLEGIVESLARAIKKFDLSCVSTLCISSAGRIDTHSGIVVYATDNLPEYTGFNLYTWVKQHYGLPCVAINDGHAALLGELLLTEEYRTKKVVMLTLGSGIGGAYAVNGRLKADEKNNYALFGHIVIEENGLRCNCGKRGCAEQYLSGRAINRQAGELGISKDGLFLTAEKGNTRALALCGELTERLKILLEKIQKISPFDICILGGGVTDGMGNFFEKFCACGFDVRRAKAGNAAGMLGAYYLGANL